MIADLEQFVTTRHAKVKPTTCNIKKIQFLQPAAAPEINGANFYQQARNDVSLGNTLKLMIGVVQTADF